MHADKAAVTRLLKTARGQIDGILKMVEQDKYCIDVVNQILASDAILRKAVKLVMQGHLEGCVKNAFKAGQDEQNAKIQEVIHVFDKLSR